MDIEGYEIEALKGMKELLLKHRPVCFLEWTQEDRDGSRLNGVELFPMEYTFYRFVSPKPVLTFFSEKNYRLARLGESWTDGNLLAVPDEYAENIDALNPLSAVARRLRGE